ncbi:hypothetical protein [Geopsychrobacter electrodiphilus]|uniref:COG4705 family protein n=1 Tax=Geopsychrobacter electrodiphilus TaxID=225196 RepID=UPI000382B810|nr:hypothetical protein [Geopsychrobacter electrodiphilus]
MKNLLLRVPEITLMFWVVKVLSTTVGETGADFLSDRLGLGLNGTTLVMSVLLAVFLVIQLRLKRYVPASYWTVVVLMSVVGTLITDMFVENFGVSLLTLSIVFTITMLAGFAVWYKSEKTLSIHSIDTNKREVYYWIIILLAFALGTGAGDLISEGINLGYGVALLTFSLSIAVVAFGYYGLKLNSTLTFWVVFILTRPLGASIGDFLIQTKVDGGLGFGMTPVNVIFLTVIVSLVFFMTLKARSSVATIEVTNGADS